MGLPASNRTPVQLFWGRRVRAVRRTQPHRRSRTHPSLVPILSGMVKIGNYTPKRRGLSRRAPSNSRATLPVEDPVLGRGQRDYRSEVGPARSTQRLPLAALSRTGLYRAGV